MAIGTTEAKADTLESVLVDCQNHADVTLAVLRRLLSLEAEEGKEPGFANLLSRLKHLCSDLQAIRSQVEDVEARVGLAL